MFDIPKEILNDNERQRRVYSIEGICPTILARTDNAKIVVLEDFYKSRPMRIYEDYAPCLRSERIGLKVGIIEE